MENKTDLAVAARGLSKRYGKRPVLDGLDLGIAQGTVYCLLGPNGTGKTTTLRLLAGLAKPDSGSVAIMGRQRQGAGAAIRSLLALAPQTSAFSPQLSVAENLELFGGLYGFGRRRRRERSAWVMASLDLEAQARTRLCALSGGVQRRVSLGMALMSEAPVILLDEPSLGLDPEARRALWRCIQGLKASTTLLLTTHYLEEADALADRIGLLGGGRIRLEGSPRELKALAQGADAPLPSLEESYLRLIGKEASHAHD